LLIIPLLENYFRALIHYKLRRNWPSTGVYSDKDTAAYCKAVLLCCLTIFCIVFRVLNAIFILVSLNNTDFHYFFSAVHPSEGGAVWFLVLWVRVIVLLLFLWGCVFHNLVCVVFVVM
jgi:sterol desaturase/sphingolipid hydroxylase (fatty acid hydroxylase superfamily)